jgi:uncharacterized protein
MNLKGRIDADLKAAMLSGDKFLTSVIRGIKSAITYQEIALKKREDGIDDSEIEQLLAKEAKKREESALLYDQGGNNEAAEKERKEKEIILGYLPEQMDESQLATIVDEEVAASGASGVQAMGQVIGKVRARVGTSADGAAIARLVKEKLGV